MTNRWGGLKLRGPYGNASRSRGFVEDERSSGKKFCFQRFENMKLSGMLLSVFIIGDGSFFGCQGPALVHNMASTMIHGVASKVREYEMLCGELPPMEEGLNALVTRPETLAEDADWVQLYKELPADPWDNPIFYFVDDELPNGFGVYSCGPDGISDSEGNDPDDVNNWD